jgi:hypothetical protein
MRCINLSYLLILFLIAVFLVVSCKSDRTGQSAGEISDEESAEIEKKIEQIKKVYNLCPSPAEMLSIIDVGNMQYNGDILHPPADKDNFLDTKSQTLNLGVYITDLAYTSLFGRNEETIDYLETVRYMAGEIRVSGTIDEELINRAKNNVSHLDSLFTISNEAFINMLNFCEKNDRTATMIMISAGAFIESLYLAVHMIEKYDPESYLVQHLAEQKYALDNLMASAENMADDPNVSATIDLLDPLVNIYNHLEITEGKTTVKKDSSDKLIIGGGDKILMSGQDFMKLKETVSTVRNNVVLKNV